MGQGGAGRDNQLAVTAMALATRCPHCQTTFRVVHDQLKLRGGLVRCGACKEIFNGVENLLPPTPPADGAPPAAAGTTGSGAGPSDAIDPAVDAGTPHAPPPSQETHAPTSPGRIDDASDADASDADSSDAAGAGAGDPAPAFPDAPATGTDFPPPTPGDTAKEHAAPPPGDGQPPSDPLLRMTLMDFTEPGRIPLPGRRSAPDDSPGGDDLARTIDALQDKPWRGTRAPAAGEEEDLLDALDSDEPEFVVRARRERQARQRRRLVFGAGSALLAAALLFQGLMAFRSQIAAWLPPVAPALAAMCRPLGCEVGLPAHIESVSIESSELQALPNLEQTYVLTILLRNRSSLPQAWPHLELTLLDENEQPVARRVLAARDYLPPSLDPAAGFGATSEQGGRLVFSLAGLKASGYRVYLFYP